MFFKKCSYREKCTDIKGNTSYVECILQKIFSLLFGWLLHKKCLNANSSDHNPLSLISTSMFSSLFLQPSTQALSSRSLDPARNAMTSPNCQENGFSPYAIRWRHKNSPQGEWPRRERLDARLCFPYVFMVQVARIWSYIETVLFDEHLLNSHGLFLWTGSDIVRRNICWSLLIECTPKIVPSLMNFRYSYYLSTCNVFDTERRN